MKIKTLTLSSLLALTLAACGSDPLSYSAPVGINLKAKSGDAKNGVVSDEKSITTETGNPFGKFVGDARAHLGRDPGRVDISKVELLLGGKSKNVAALEQVFSGEIVAQLVIDETKNTFNVGKLAAPTGTGPAALALEFDWSKLNDADRKKFMNGSFKVVIRGPTVTGFDKLDAEADLQLTFTFAAFE